MPQDRFNSAETARDRHVAAKFWVFLTAILISFDIFFLWLDRNFYFLIGDSAVYLNSGLGHHFYPDDRSFTYGTIILAFILNNFGALGAVVVFQSIMSVLSALILSAILRTGFKISYLICLFASLGYVAEPLNLLLQRFILTENASLFFFALFLLTGVFYILYPRIVLLALLAFLGVAVVSLRTSFVPVILICSLAIPLFPAWSENMPARGRSRHWAFLFHVAMAALLCLSSQTLYKRWAGDLRGSAPSYGAGDGFFLLASWAPLVTSKDFPDRDTYEKVMAKVKFSLEDRRLRPGHRFAPDGLVSAIMQTSPSPQAANALANRIARHAGLRDPLGVLRLGWLTYLDFWDARYLEKEIPIEMGKLEVDQPLIDYFNDHFHDDISGRYLLQSPIKQWFSAAILWYHFILLSPLIFIALMLRRKWSRLSLFLGLCSGLLLCSSIFFVTEAVVRYLHPMALLAVIGTALLAQWGLDSVSAVRSLRGRASVMETS